MNKRTLLLALICALLASLSIAQPAFALPAQTYPHKIRVVEVRFFPAGSNYVYHPDTLSTQLQGMIKDASSFHKYAVPTATPSTEIEVVQVINHQGKRPTGNGDWEESYKQILQNDNLCDIITTQNIDQLWIWADPRAGFDEAPGQEYAISSNRFRNLVQPAVIPSTPFCGGARGFTFFEFDFSRTADLALHSYGHYLEGLIANVQSRELFWQRYAGENSGSFLRSERCGNVHFPPNGRNDYDYSNSSYVKSACESWDPALTGTKVRMNCTRWGCTQEGYLKWWMQNMPNQNNTLTYLGKKLPNWFDFTYDIDSALNNYAADSTYFTNTSFMDANKPPLPLPDHIGTSTSAKQNSGTVLTMNHTVTGTNPLLIVSASYRAATNPTAALTSVTYGSQNLTFIRRDAHADRVTEMWYLQNPPAGTQTVTGTWNLNPEDQIITATTLYDVAADPIARSAGAGSNLQDGTHAGAQSLTIASSPAEVVLGVLSTYPDGSLNSATAKNDTVELWNVKTTQNNIASQGAGEKGASSVTLEFASPINWSWAMSGVSIRIIPTPSVSVSLTADKLSYVRGTDTVASLTTRVTDEYGNPISGLSGSAFVSELDGITPVTLTYTEAPAGTYTASLDLTSLQNGNHTLFTTVTDSRALSGSASVLMTLSDPIPVPTTSLVSGITYALEGGKQNNKNLVITAHIVNDLAAAVPGASVSMQLKKSTTVVLTATGTTDASGNVTFTYLNAAAACYSSTITQVTSTGLTWDGVTPSNQFCK